MLSSLVDLTLTKVNPEDLLRLPQHLQEQCTTKMIENEFVKMPFTWSYPCEKYIDMAYKDRLEDESLRICYSDGLYYPSIGFKPATERDVIYIDDANEWRIFLDGRFILFSGAHKLDEDLL